MQATDQSNDRLHQQASAQYLQGKFEEALAAWRQILANDPSDERASEGVRLCEMLTKENSDNVVTADSAPAAGAAPAVDPAAVDTPPAEATPESDPAVAADPVEAGPAADGDAENFIEPEDTVEFELPNLELDLPESEMPDPQRQSEGIDLGETPEALSIDGDLPAAPAEQPEAQSQPWDTPQPVSEADAEPATEAAAQAADPGPIVDAVFGDAQAAAEPAVGEPGEAELQKRAQDLVSEARAAFESGDAENARTVLKRVFILDETNAEALQLQEQLEAGVPPATDQVDVSELDAPDHSAAPGEFDLDADAPEAGDGLELQDLQAAPEPAAETVAEPGRVEAPAEAEDDFADFDVDEEIADIDDLEDEELEAAETGKAGIKLPQLDVGNSKTRFIAIGVVVGLVLVVGVGFWMKLRAVETIEPAAPTAQAGEPATSPGPAAAAEAQPAETPPAEVETTPPVPGEDVATLLDRANTAYEAGDYASAIVALDAVLKQDPGHFEANEKMQAATAAYKRQQEVQQQWGAAAALFRDGEFRSAMQMFYRLPVDGEENRLRLERYKVNGWYNMGLLALRSGQCELARSHFSEASQIDPEDADVEMALALCDTCEGGTRRSGFQRALASMKMRSLDS